MIRLMCQRARREGDLRLLLFTSILLARRQPAANSVVSFRRNSGYAPPWTMARRESPTTGLRTGALVLGRVRRLLSTNATLAVAGVILAVALALLVLVPIFGVALLVLVFAGLAWTSTISTLVAEL